MRRAKSLCAMLHGQLTDWFHSPRTIISVIILLALAYMNVRSFAYMLAVNGLYAFAEETAYHYLSSGFGNLALTSALFLIMMAEIPRRTPFQNVLLIRSNRSVWLASQVLFCLLSSVLMIAFMIMFCMVFSAPHISSGHGWSDLERIAADPDAAWMPSFTERYIWSVAPLSAVGAAFLILLFFWFTMALVILLMTLWGKPNVGLIAYVSLLVLHVTVTWEALPPMLRRSPIQFATLSAVAGTFFGREMQSIPYVVLGYLVIDAAFIVIMHHRVCHMELFFADRGQAI